ESACATKPAQRWWRRLQPARLLLRATPRKSRAKAPAPPSQVSTGGAAFSLPDCCYAALHANRRRKRLRHQTGSAVMGQASACQIVPTLRSTQIAGESACATKLDREVLATLKILLAQNSLYYPAHGGGDKSNRLLLEALAGL